MTKQKSVGWKTVVVALMAVPVMIGILMWRDAHPPSLPPRLTQSQYTALQSAFVEQGWPVPNLEITQNGVLVATVVIDESVLDDATMKKIGLPRVFASKAVIVLRNTELPFNVVDSYRVTVNGPPPGPGLIHRYGSARFLEGSSVTWEPGLPR